MSVRARSCVHAIATCETPVKKPLSAFLYSVTHLSFDFHSPNTTIAQVLIPMSLDFCNSYLNAFPPPRLTTAN